MDSETGLYYYGARYLDPKYSHWLSPDPAMGKYISGSTAGGGIYNEMNMQVYHYAGNNPVRYTDPDGKTVDYGFVKQYEGGQLLNGYVPTRKDGTVIGRSGVTIAAGFDLGQQNSYDLNRIFGTGNTNKDLKDLYTPYLGKQKVEAQTYLKDHPLTITQEQADRTDTSVLKGMLPSITKQYEKSTGGKFANLPDQAQTVIFDLGYQFGQDSGIPSDVMDKIKNGNYSGASDSLESMGKGQYTNRRNAEAALLRQ